MATVTKVGAIQPGGATAESTATVLSGLMNAVVCRSCGREVYANESARVCIRCSKTTDLGLSGEAGREAKFSTPIDARIRADFTIPLKMIQQQR
jgi:hypothetical protein